jgi:hypothetical protein
MAFRNQKLKEKYYDRIRRKVCVKCESFLLFTNRLCVNCHEKDLEYDRIIRLKKGNIKVYHSNKLAEKYNSYGIIKTKDEKCMVDEI